MDLTITATTAAVDAIPADPGCGCCKPAPPTSADDQVRALEARRDELQRRLAGLESGARR